MGDPKNVCIGSDMFKEKYVVPSDPASPCTDAVVQGLSGALPTIRVSDIDGACCLRKLGAVADRVYAEKLSNNNCVKLLGDKVPNAGPICKDIVYELEHDADNPRFLTWSWLKHQLVKMSGTTIEQAPSAILFGIAFVLAQKWFGGGGGHGGGTSSTRGKETSGPASSNDDSAARIIAPILETGVLTFIAVKVLPKLTPALTKIHPALILLPSGVTDYFRLEFECETLERDTQECQEWKYQKDLVRMRQNWI